MSVKQLKEFHDRHNVGTCPTYSYDSKPGGGFTGICVYRGKRCRGEGPSKKEAQRRAAESMLLALNVLPIIESPSVSNFGRKDVAPKEIRERSKTPLMLNADQEMNAMRFLDENQELASYDVRSTMDPARSIIDEDVDLGLKKVDAPKLTILLSLSDDYGDAIDTFKHVMKEMKLQYSCRVPEIKSDGKSPSHVVLIRLHYKYLMAGGIGPSPAYAAYQACAEALKMLRVLVT